MAGERWRAGDLGVRALVVALVALAGCGVLGGVVQRFPDDVQAVLAHDDMRRIETDRFIIYYPAGRRAEIDRFLARAGRCVDALRDAALIHDGPWRDKMVVVLPEVALNNAFVMPELFGYDHVSVIPTLATFDFASEYGLLPDPGYIACHELVHYVNLEQVAGLWKYLNLAFGHLYTPQVGYDAWFLEGLATHYESKLSPGVGRPTWPVFTGMFAAGYAGQQLTGGDLSELGRLAPPGHHYLVGSMFLRFMAERYGERPLWRSIADQASTITGMFPASSFRAGFGVGLSTLLDQFEAWHQQTFPARPRPPNQQRLATLGNDARYARGRDGTEAWVANDVDAPTRLVVRAPDGRRLAELPLIDVLPPRTLVQADPLEVSGLSVTADGHEVWLTAIDQGTTYQVTRLLRWRRGDTALTEVGPALGPGATIDPTGAIYYYCAVDGDRWSLAAWDVQRHTRRTLVDAAPGTYVLGAQISPDGTRLAADVWDGTSFAVWILDAGTGARLATMHGTAPGSPLWDPSFTDDGRVLYLGEVAGRFQIFLDGQPISDAPYTMLAARATRGTIRFLNRDGWNWTLDEIALAPATSAPVAAAAASASDRMGGQGSGAPGAPSATSTGVVGATSTGAVGTTSTGVVGATSTGAVGTTSTGVVGATSTGVVGATSTGAVGTTSTGVVGATSTGATGATSTGATSMDAPGAPAPGAPLSPSAVVLTDEPYHAWDHLFVPQLHSPVAVTVSNGMPHIGAVLGGGDRLGLQRWSIAGYGQYDSSLSDKIHWGADAGYLNTMLAPWQIIATAGFVDWVDSVSQPDSDVTLAEPRRTRDAAVTISRTWRGSLTTALSGVYTDDDDRYPGDPDLRRHLGGPALSATWVSAEPTAYTGYRRGVFAAGSAAYYPHALSTFTGDIYDTGGQLGAILPLPFGRRHVLTIGVRGRALLARDDTHLLQLGGDSGLAELWSGSSVSNPTPDFDTSRFPPNLRFIETLRGYEDYAITTDRAAIADISWRYPLIIDRGVATSLWIFPASFLSELDLELFATAAVDRATDLHAAAGAQLSAQFTLFRFPLDLIYQVARRLRDDNALTQLLGLGFAL